jgi:cytochrome c oxidase subunit I
MIMGVAAIFGMFAGTYYWFPKMFGRMMNETWGRIHFFITLAWNVLHFHADALSGMAGNRGVTLSSRKWLICIS